MKPYKYLLGILLSITFLTPVRGAIIYVKADATGANDGTSWINALTVLHTAISNAQPGDTIWVAKGSYSPQLTASASLVLKGGVTLLGHFAGDETMLSQRDLSNPVNETIVTGQNICEHVFKKEASDGNGLTILDGFTISGGYANGDPGLFRADGGGILFDQADSVMIVNCTFKQNYAASYGGAVSCRTSGNIIFANCVFFDNASPVNMNADGISQGGAMYISAGKLSIINCTFANNSAQQGGAIYNDHGIIGITNSILWGNTATDGTADQKQIFNLVSSPELTNNLVQGGCPANSVCVSIPIDEDPQFVDIVNGNLSLTECSPAINEGDNDSIPATLLTDIAGNPRINNYMTDLGAYELQFAISSFSKTTAPLVPLHFAASDFSDHYSNQFGPLLKIKIHSLPSAGTFKLGNVPIQVGQLIDIADAGNIVYQGDSCIIQASFDWSGMTNNACTLDQYLSEVTIDITNTNIQSRPPRPTIIEPASLAFCDGDSIYLSAPEGYDVYLWSTGDATRTITVKTGHSWSVRAGNTGCLSLPSSAVQTNVKPVPAAPAATDSYRCLAGDITLTASGSNNYSWYPTLTSTTPIHTTSSVQLTNLPANDTLYVATAEDGCYSPRTQVIAHIQSAPPKPYSVKDTTYCSGKSLKLTGYGADAYTYSWYICRNGVDVPLGTGKIITIPPAQLSVTDTILISSVNGACESDKDTIFSSRITTPAKPALMLVGSDIFCEGDSVKVIAPAGFDIYRWLLQDEEGNITNISGASNELVVKNYVLLGMTVTNAGCISAYSNDLELIMIATPKPVITTSGTTGLCDGQQVTLSVAGTLIGQVWSTGETTTDIIVNQPGSYTVKAEYENGCTSKDADSIKVSILAYPNKPVVKVTGNTVFCEGGQVLLSAPDHFPFYEWSDGRSTPAIMAQQSGFYKARVKNANGCASDWSDTIIVTVKELPPAPTQIIPASSDSLLAIGTGDQYEWRRDGQLLSQSTAKIKVTATGLYTVKAINAAGCYSLQAASYSFTVTGIEEAMQHEFNIYPNPGNGLFYIDAGAAYLINGDIMVVNAIGQVISSQPLHFTGRQFQLNLTAVTPGYYYLIIRQGKLVRYKKVIIR